ncbi:hypothetical protein JNK62_01820 [bacterium]|nr:hypothetical protein [bacterium]
MIASRTFRLALVFLVSALFIAAIITPHIALGQEAAAQATIEPNDSCSIWNGTWGFNCGIWYPFMSALGTLLLSFSISVLVVLGAIFDQFLSALVVSFQDTLVSLNILGGIQIAWQLFRDITNVVIIGVFVFVAIMTILGSTEYGTKRLVSRVLIVAILINFSLLFTRVVIESTNFVSAQFARSMPNNALTAGVAQSFLQAFGIDGTISGTYELTRRVATETDSGWAALIYGVVAGSVLLVIALVFLYGIVIISARALLLVFMMITAPIAFASFLIPTWSNQAYIGWNNWWSNLLKAAMFGPIFMVFLWIAMQIIARGSVANAGAALGKLANDPSKMDVNAWQQLIFLMIGTGVLFIGIRASSSFAASIGGFNWATVASLLPVTLGSRFAAAPALRRFVGQPALERQLQYEDDIKRAKARGDWSQAALLQKDYSKAAKMASRDFNAMNSNVSKLLTKSLGVPSMLGGEKKLGGAAGIATAAAKETAKELKNLQPSAQDLASASKAAASEVREGNKALAESLKGDRDAAVARREAAGGSGSGTRTEQKQITDTIRKAVEDGSSSGANAAQRQIEHKREVDAERKAEIGQVTNKIAEVKTDVNRNIAQEINDAQAALGPLSMLDADVTNATNRMTMNQFETNQKAIEASQNAQLGAIDMLQSAIQDSLSRSGNDNAATAKIAMKLVEKQNPNVGRVMSIARQNGLK